MRITQGTFSFLPDLTDEQIEAQIVYSLENGWAMSVEHTDDPHPRNSYWEMWGLPLFDLTPEDADQFMREVRACREAFPNEYVKVLAYDPTKGRQTTALSFIVNRPDEEPGFRLDRMDYHDRTIRYTLHPYATEKPEGKRYLNGSAATNGAAASAGETPGGAGS
ncbi:MAG TPA: ribulose bisphosphate carboxylase small subunit [Solirubrobacteraceae bacterium]|jgi:ribulose-bisphosphate carboxylase small chain|nr:ribulose bisphosphate carboxylase small subunit [Solirubrobacteraceae bacterium]